MSAMVLLRGGEGMKVRALPFPLAVAGSSSPSEVPTAPAGQELRWRGEVLNCLDPVTAIVEDCDLREEAIERRAATALLTVAAVE